jgi:hypothetical protein
VSTHPGRGKAAGGCGHGTDERQRHLPNTGFPGGCSSWPWWFKALLD